MQFNTTNLTTLAMPWPDYVDHILLVANTPKSYTIPKGYKYMVLAADQTIFMAAYGSTADIPAGDVTDGTGCFPGTGALMDIERISRDNGSISLSTANAAGAKVGIALFHG